MESVDVPHWTDQAVFVYQLCGDYQLCGSGSNTPFKTRVNECSQNKCKVFFISTPFGHVHTQAWPVSLYSNDITTFTLYFILCVGFEWFD